MEERRGGWKGEREREHVDSIPGICSYVILIWQREDIRPVTKSRNRQQ